MSENFHCGNSFSGRGEYDRRRDRVQAASGPIDVNHSLVQPAGQLVLT